jgi:FixJ family two-component response regulator/anti-sigma regulatory factor (Ser/Thr protein kinase)
MFLIPGQSTTLVRSSQKVVLIIDDELLLLETMQDLLESLGYEVFTAPSVDDAEKIVTKRGTHAFDCVLTDYQMPKKTGLALLQWLKEYDSDLSIIVNTAYADHKDVSAMMREGAIDILHKPVDLDQLEAAVKLAIETTAKRRKTSQTAKAVKQVGLVHDYLLEMLGVKDLPFLKLCFEPSHQIGGDFLIYCPSKSDEYLMLFADTSGHDLDAGYLSAYFTGYVNGMAKGNFAVGEMVHELNRFLIEKWNARDFFDNRSVTVPEASICTCFIRKAEKGVEIHNNGLPASLLTNRDGVSRFLGETSSPLGLFEDPETFITNVVDVASSALLIRSDGVEDYADELKVSALSLAFRFINDSSEAQKELLRAASDDIMIARLELDLSESCKYYPLLLEIYTGAHIAEIDHIEDFWSRSLLIAMPEINPEVLYAILITTREALLNGLRHGCRYSADLDCVLQMHWNQQDNSICVRIEDPGEGYEDDYLTNPEPDETVERHSGLILMRNFPDKVRTERRGATVIMDFSLLISR